MHKKTFQLLCGCDVIAGDLHYDNVLVVRAIFIFLSVELYMMLQIA